jgi:hypothetical protein
MAKTRSKPAVKVSDTSQEKAVVKKPPLPPAESNPPKLFILPKNASKDARILTLPNPATSKRNRYFSCPETGLYEFTSIAAPSSTPRSLLITSQGPTKKLESEESGGTSEDKGTKAGEMASSSTNDYISSSASLFVATPVDLLFFLLPIIAPLSSQKKGKGMFLTFEDYIESTSEQFKRLLKPTATRELFAKRLKAICDTVEAGDETMFRLSVGRLVGELITKAKRMVMKGLPASMEDRFIQQALQAPVMTLKREDSATSGALAKTTTTEEPSQPDTTDAQDSAPATKDSQDSQTLETSITIEATSISTDAHIAKAEEVPEHLKDLLRIRTCLNFISQSYLPPHLRTAVQTHLSTNTAIDFSSLNTHLKKLNLLHEEARALRSLSDNVSRKRLIEDDEALEIRAEKKRKKEEEEKRKKTEGRAIRQLKKADTSGMKKMSSFFTKLPKK